MEAMHLGRRIGSRDLCIECVVGSCDTAVSQMQPKARKCCDCLDCIYRCEKRTKVKERHIVEQKCIPSNIEGIPRKFARGRRVKVLWAWLSLESTGEQKMVRRDVSVRCLRKPTDNFYKKKVKHEWGETRRDLRKCRIWSSSPLTVKLISLR